MKPDKAGIWEWFEEDGTKRLVSVCDVGAPVGMKYLRVYWWGDITMLMTTCRSQSMTAI